MPEYFSHQTAIIDEGCEIGNGSKIWHFSHVMTGSKIGNNCILGQNVFIAPHVFIGNNVKIQNNVSLYTGIHCEDDVFIGPSAVFTNVINPRSFIDRKDQFQKSIIGKGASIGANATIICGNKIGKFALIGAGTVVVRDVPDYALVVGNPSNQIGWIGEFGIKLNFNQKNEAICPESGDRYILSNQTVRKIS